MVEDEETVGNFVRQVLEGQRGYRILSAASQEEACELFKDQDWEVALLLTERVISGEKGFVWYKKTGWLALKVLFISGYALQEGELSPQISVLQKPFFPEMLINKIREILDA
ncbi:MAG: hypothetical protein C0407_11260 [Desulfobacca sp.]|nr:hypothetical protein [Desulfobacca sp.]